MKLCDTCKWADDNGQEPGKAICRARPPQPTVLSTGQGTITVLGVFPVVTLNRDSCKEHEEGRERIHLATELPHHGDN